MQKCGNKPKNNLVGQGLVTPGLKYNYGVPVFRGTG